MKAVLISIQPKWCEMIASGEKTLEVRKTMPTLATPFKVFIYCTKAPKGWFWFDSPNIRRDGAVIGEFICGKINRFDVPYPAYQKKLDPEILKASCCTYYQLHRYAYHDSLYGWHISDLKIYETPLDLSNFFHACDKPSEQNCSVCEESGNAICKQLRRAPQSWCYVMEVG